MAQQGGASGNEADRPALRDFQTWMQTFIVTSGAPEEALRAAEAASGLGEGSARRLVKSSPTLAEMERLMIYRRMYPLRMEEALSMDFPACRRLLGGAAFRGLVEEYVEAHPSRSWTLDHLSQHIVEFVRTHPLSTEHSGLYDLTVLEQALCDVFNAADSSVLTSADMAKVSPETWPEVCLECIPALRLLALDSNANDLYKAHGSDQKLPEHRPGPQRLVVWRHQFQTWRMPLQEPAFLTLQRLRDGHPIGEALGYALDHYPLDEGQVFDWFNTWVSEGFFQAHYVAPCPTAVPTTSDVHPPLTPPRLR